MLVYVASRRPQINETAGHVSQTAGGAGALAGLQGRRNLLARLAEEEYRDCAASGARYGAS